LIRVCLRDLFQASKHQISKSTTAITLLERLPHFYLWHNFRLSHAAIPLDKCRVDNREAALLA
jgi:hypothetical protein